MKMTQLLLPMVILGSFACSNAFAKGDATGEKLLSSCKTAVKEYCGDVKNKKDAKEIFDCLEKHEDNLRSEKEHKKCYAAHEAFEKAHQIEESGEEHHE